VTTAQAVPLLSRKLHALATAYDDEAAAADHAGGSWSAVVAVGHRRASSQLRLIGDLVVASPTDAMFDLAFSYADAGVTILEQIRRANA